MAFKFTGTNSYIDCGNPAVLQITGNITVAAWIQFTTSQSNKPIVAKWGSSGAYALLVDSTANKISFYLRVSSTSKGAVSTKTYNNNRWCFVVGRFNGANVLLTIFDSKGNIVEDIIGSATAGPIDNPASTPIRIATYSNSTGAFTGIISDVFIINRCLSLEDLKSLMNKKYLHKLSGYWPLTKNAHDYSGNGNNGTITAASVANPLFLRTRKLLDRKFTSTMTTAYPTVFGWPAVWGMIR